MTSLPHHRTRDQCRLCGSTDLVVALELQATPPANALLSKDLLSQKEYFYPLRVSVCGDCHHAQLIDVINPNVLFGDYRYRSGISPMFVSHLSDLASELLQCSNVSAPFVVEIGSNDGTLIEVLTKLGARTLGVEPSSRLARYANDRNRETMNAFFGSESAADIRQLHGPADIICANNVLAHIDNLRDVFSGISSLLSDGGLFVFEVSYLVDVLKKGLFDTIYHEHLSYHSVMPMQRFLQTFGLKLFAAKKVDTQGGSIRFYVEHESGDRPVEQSVGDLAAAEAQMGLECLQPYRDLMAHISATGSAFRDRLHQYRMERKSIAGFGAPAKITTLLHEFRISGDDFAFIAEENEFKKNLYTPGTHIEIRGPDSLYGAGIDIVVIFAWNFAPNIIKRHRALLDEGVIFIIPLPSLIEVNRDNIDAYLSANSAGSSG